MTTKYPTKKEIFQFAKTLKINPIIIKNTIKWKKKFIIQWNKTTPNKKTHHLTELIYDIIIPLLQTYKTTLPSTKIHYRYKYNQSTETIYLDKKNPSIISTLHELAHHLYGPDELMACTWSTQLFKQCFPSFYKKLTWEKHLLIKK